jgi:hypothetical protein
MAFMTAIRIPKPAEQHQRQVADSSSLLSAKIDAIQDLPENGARCLVHGHFL